MTPPCGFKIHAFPISSTTEKEMRERRAPREPRCQDVCARASCFPMGVHGDSRMPRCLLLESRCSRRHEPGRYSIMRAIAILLLTAAPTRAVQLGGGRGGVLVVGSANVDLIAYAPRMPTAGETLMGSKFEKLPGGKGANQAVAAAKLGSRTQFISALGQDVLGDESIAGYEACGIDTQHIVRIADASTGCALITVDETSGNNMIVVVAGAGGSLCDAHLAAAADAFETSAVLLTQLEVPMETTIAALRRGRASGVLTVCNTAPAPEDGLPDELLGLADVLCPNESEAAVLTGMPTGTDEQCEAAGRALLAKGVGAVVMTVGANPSLAMTLTLTLTLTLALTLTPTPTL